MLRCRRVHGAHGRSLVKDVLPCASHDIPTGGQSYCDTDAGHRLYAVEGRSRTVRVENWLAGMELAKLAP